MDLQLWAEISAAISDVHRRVTHRPRDHHPTSRIVRLHLWSVLHDRPTAWACDPDNWTEATRPPALPHQSRMSRRMKRADFDQFLTLLNKRLATSGSRRLNPLGVKIADGMALEISPNSRDRDARWGRGVGRKAKGYKLHAICSGKDLPDDFVVTSLEVSEKKIAARMLKRLNPRGKTAGYLLADALYNANWFFDFCAAYNHQLLCPRAMPEANLGHGYHSPHRLRAMAMLEVPAYINPFGRTLYRQRDNIERTFSRLVSFGGGLTVLPSWVRRIWRVKRWVWAKLLITAARARCVRKRRIAA